jgi:hypothetical protein
VLGVFFFFFVVVVVVALLELLLVVVVVVLVLVVVVVLLLALVVAATFVLTTLVDLVVVDGLFYSWFIVIEDNASRTSERIPSKPMNNKSWAYAGTYYYVDEALLNLSLNRFIAASRPRFPSAMKSAKNSRLYECRSSQSSLVGMILPLRMYSRRTRS